VPLRNFTRSTLFCGQNLLRFPHAGFEPGTVGAVSVSSVQVSGGAADNTEAQRHRAMRSE